jgi:beta-aspartyl-peptidase (threonine type)
MDFQLMIHGGAGTVENKHEYEESVEEVLREGQQMLAAGSSALDVVERCVVLLENDPIFNAGRGSVLSHTRHIEMDAALMSGIDLEAGSVAGVIEIKNPISLARKVMDESEHVMLIGKGAMDFAHLHSVEKEPLEYFLTEKRIEQWEKAQKHGKSVLDHSSQEEIERKFGTVGAVARDVHGNLAAGTSTGGITNKKYGRVGDTPLIGCGVFADNETCAVSATGYGEQFIRTTLSKTVSEYVKYLGMNAQEASDEAIKYLVTKVRGLGGVIVIDKNGNFGSACSTEAMIHGKANADGITVLT